MAALMPGRAALAQDADLPPPPPPIDAVPPPPPEIEPPPVVEGEDGDAARWVRIAPLRVRYFVEREGLPRLEETLRATVDLVAREEGLDVPADEEAARAITIGELCDGTERTLSLEAVNRVCESLYGVLQRRGLVGVLVAPDPRQINPRTGRDARGGDTALDIFIYVAVVGEVRTVGSGDRVAEADRINSRAHDRIRRLSPVQADTTDPERAFIQRDLLDDYVLRLNRHPGRRVDVAIAPTESRDKAVLDYLVAENKPWTLYAQLSNTGTEDTDEWRERLGLTHTQLLGRDDILSLDYITAGFSEAHALIGSYDAPVMDSERLRLRLYGNYSSFEASDVGLASERFSGESWTLGAELVLNAYQDRDFFIDAFAGARWQSIEVENEIAEVKGSDDVFLGRAGLRAERRDDLATLGAGVAVEWSMPGISGSDEDELERLGRLDVDEDWVVFQFDAGYSFFLEPVLNYGEWSKPRVPQDRSPGGRYAPGLSTLAHELVLGVRGQYAFENRLIPNAEQVVGGLYTVRGYPESVVAGDSVIIGTVEYRFHVPRALAIQPEPSRVLGRDFRLRPQQQYGRPDWDLVLRAFVDGARVVNSNRLPFERDEALLGAGVGAELLLYQNVSVRMDWGMALEDVENQNVKVGSNRFHFVFTLLF